jgi:hypothetical protein
MDYWKLEGLKEQDKYWGYSNLTEDRFEAGINIGLEFLANKNESIFYIKKRIRYENV